MALSWKRLSKPAFDWVEVAGIAALFLLAGMATAWTWPGKAALPSETARDAVWIEFENIQHALDAAGKLGGAYRGLTVCVGTKHVERDVSLWVPNGVSMSGDAESCRFARRQSLPVMTVHGSSTISSMSIGGRAGIRYEYNTASGDNTWQSTVDDSK